MLSQPLRSILIYFELLAGASIKHIEFAWWCYELARIKTLLRQPVFLLIAACRVFVIFLTI